MAHSRESHEKNMNRLCRVCGQLNLTKKEKKVRKKPYLIDDILSRHLAFVCGFSVTIDTYHSKYLCNKCHTTMKNCQKRSSLGSRQKLIEHLETSRDLWSPFADNLNQSCSICTHVHHLTTPIGNARKNQVANTVNHMKKQNTSHNTNQQHDLDDGNKHDDQPTDNSISIHSINDSTVNQILKDKNTFEQNTIQKHSHTQDGADDMTQKPTLSDMGTQSIHEYQTLGIDSLTHHTDATTTNKGGYDIGHDSEHINLSTNASSQTSPVKYLFIPSDTDRYTPQTHSTPKTREIMTSPIKISPLKSTTATSPMIKAINTVDTTMNKSVSEPLTEIEEHLATKLIKRKLNYSGNGKSNIIKLKTRGQPLTFVRTVVPRKNHETLGKTSKNNRRRLINYTRDVVGCKIESELSLLPKTRRNSILEKAKLNKRIRLNQQQSLALKETLGLSSRKARLMGQSLREFGVHLAGEKKQREMVKEIVKEYVCVKQKHFHTEDLSKITKVSVTRLNNIPQYVDQRLSHLEEKGLLTWHNGGIPEDTILIKIGADHGKNLLKFTLEIVNTHSPNSKLNTIVIGMAAVKDTYENLQTFLEGGLLDDIKRLQGHRWKGKKIRLTLNGDYDFLCKVYGISGPVGCFPCIWCLIPKHELQKPRQSYETRSLESLAFNYRRFMNAEFGNKKNVKNFYNCLHEPLLPIELDDVSPPYLHILLGIVWRHHILLKKEAHKLDLELLTQTLRTCTEIGLKLKDFGGCYSKVDSLNEQIRDIDTFMNFSDNNAERQMLLNLYEKTENELANLAFKALDENSGPVSASLEPILESLRVTSRPYHGGAFTGNHCHKYVASKVYEKLTDEIIKQTQLYTLDPFIIDHAHIIKLKFDTINKAFYKIHLAISHTNHIAQDSIDSLQQDIDNYMHIFNTHFPGNLLPKHHILHKHVIPHIRRYGFGMGLLGEQGTENSHQTISKIEQRAVSIVNELDKLKFIMTTHYLGVSPMLQSIKISDDRKRKSLDKKSKQK